MLLQYFDPLHISSGVEIGVFGAGGHSAFFVTADAALDYLPASGVPGPLDNDVLHPTSTSAGSFGGFVLPLQLNIDYADTGHLPGNFPDLRICALTTHRLLQRPPVETRGWCGSGILRARQGPALTEPGPVLPQRVPAPG